MTISKKMILLVMSALLGILLLSGVAYQQMNQVYTAANYANINSVPSIVAINTLRNALNQQIQRTYSHILTTDEAAMKELDKGLLDNEGAIQSAIEEYTKLLSDSEDEQLLATDRKAIEAFIIGANKVLTHSRANENEL
eukprot:gene17020-20819_t